MKSFPSTLNESKAMYGSGKYESYRQTFDIDKLKAINLNTSAPVLQELLKEQNIDISDYNGYESTYTVESPAFRENPTMLPYDVIALAKDYEWCYNEPAYSLIGTESDGGKIKHKISEITIAPSMFNPMYGVNVRGITSNVPLLNNVRYDSGMGAESKNLTSCSIRELCSLSKNPNSILGMATYKYADFMYCKDLGKVSNNHLITLRKFAHPVSDHIFELSAPQWIDKNNSSFEQEGDVGRLITWFGTDDNRLEDIIKYSYHSTWKRLESDIQQEDSTAEDPSQGILGLLANTSHSYNNSIGEGTAATNNFWTYLGGKIGVADAMTQGAGKNNELLRNYDKNRVYTPKNTIQETHMYEGKIEFSHEFTLNFSYKLRAYDNINPKSAFLDLIGNILEVTGRRGKFWGGSRKLIGPQQDTSFYKQAYSLIDKSYDNISGVWGTLMSGGLQFDNIVAAIGKGWDAIKGGAQAAADIVNKALDNVSGTQPREIIKGFLKNALGRPTLIAWNSLLSGSDTGLWHVTIGNPKNPIMVMGNLIVTDSQISQSGPLGLDDFPTELKVSITLKHARPRDITDISRMYTKGIASIYNPLASRGLDKYVDSVGSGDYQLLDKASMATENVSTKSTSNASNKNQVSTQIKQNHSNTTKGGSTASMKQQNSLVHNEYLNQTNTWNKNSKVNNIGETPNIPNPFITDDSALQMSQLNNYSSLMAVLSADELI